ncbi:MAG TPA: PAS domain S-box protein [Chitinophaga sp.]|uniref:PAS domain-containing protein n=1 Tax=Chitinophaga sp. TaxID=1869181 RepID=UPI002DB71EE5|nr:PAS domain S-box protein [Chitinophaga sp.]HEU4551576.1 PAS domain S-box protein [Chitinophaga sp.]
MSKPTSPLAIIVIYAVCGIIWGLGMELLAALLGTREHPMLLDQLLNHREIIFVLLSAILLYRLFKNNEQTLRQSKQAYIRMFSENPQPMWIYNKENFRFLEVNDAAVHLYGYTREEFMKMTILDIRPEEDVARIVENKEKQTAAGYNDSGIWRHYKKDGSLMYVKIEAFTITYDNKATEVISVADITSQYLAKEALQRQEQLLKSIINSSQAMVWAVNAQWQFMAVNRVFQDKCGLLTGLQEPSLFWKTHYEKSLQGEKNLVEIHNETAEEEWKYIEVSFDPIFQNGNITGVVCLARDISGKKQQEINLRKALERYDIVTMATNDAIWDFDLHSNKIIWNDNAIHFFGFSNREEDVDFWIKRIHPDDEALATESVYQAVKEGRNQWQGKYRLKDINGQYRHVISRGYIVYNEKGEPARMIGALQDVEDITVKNEEIRRLSLVASMADNPVLITDRQGCIEWVNKSFEDLTGYALEDVKGLKPHTFLHGEDTNQDTAQEIRDKLEALQPCVVEILNYTSTGKPYWVLIDITPITDASGQIERHIVIQTNITEKKKIVQQLEEKNRLLTDIAFISSHRLRMPVASILGIFAQFDKENLASPNNRLFLDYIEKLANDLDGMLHEMADKCNQIYGADKPEDSE